MPRFGRLPHLAPLIAIALTASACSSSRTDRIASNTAFLSETTSTQTSVAEESLYAPALGSKRPATDTPPGLEHAISPSKAKELVRFRVRVPQKWPKDRRMLGMAKLGDKVIIYAASDTDRFSDIIQITEEAVSSETSVDVPPALAKKLYFPVSIRGNQGIAREATVTRGYIDESGIEAPEAHLPSSRLTWQEDGTRFVVMSKAPVAELLAVAEAMAEVP